MAAILVDTNVLVYAYDRAEPKKQRRALDVLDRLVAADAGVLSTPVLAEFYNTSTRKIATPLHPSQAYEQVKHFTDLAGAGCDRRGGIGDHPRCARAPVQLLGCPDFGRRPLESSAGGL